MSYPDRRMYARPSLYACAVTAVWFEMFGLRAMISADVLFAATRGCTWPRSGRPSPLKLPMRDLNTNTAFSSFIRPSHTSTARTCPSNSISRSMGGDSSTLGCSRGNGGGILLQG